jgi:hypothetical protein
MSSKPTRKSEKTLNQTQSKKATTIKYKPTVGFSESGTTPPIAKATIIMTICEKKREEFLR